MPAQSARMIDIEVKVTYDPTRLSDGSLIGAKIKPLLDKLRCDKAVLDFGDGTSIDATIKKPAMGAELHSDLPQSPRGSPAANLRRR